MMYLTGASNPGIARAAAHANIGLMMQPDSRYEQQMHHFRHFALDNGCFAKGDTFNDRLWFGWLTALSPYQSRCLFAVAPDVVGNAQATWERSYPWFDRIRELGYPVALVAQNGLEEQTDLDWSMFDALFIGGDTSWKLSPMSLFFVHEARRRGKWVHMGRVNSRLRFNRARDMGCLSADGNYIKYGPDKNLPRLLSWLGDTA